MECFVPADCQPPLRARLLVPDDGGRGVNMKIQWPSSLALLALAAFLVGCVAQRPDQSASRMHEPPGSTIFFIPHAEMDLGQASIPLTTAGHARAATLVRTFEDVPLTHVLSSHTLRSRQTVTPVAEARGMDVQALPPQGTTIGDHTIGDASPSDLAIGPLADAIAKLPDGSRALVSGNSNNLFAIMNRLGVPSATAASPCPKGGNCVPCVDNACFPDGFDGLWVLILRGAPASHQLIWLKY